MAAVLDFGRPVAVADDDLLLREIAARLASVPRLRQVVLPAPFLGGGRYWVDAPRFRPEEHVDVTSVGAGDEALFAAAALMAVSRFSSSRPMWRARLIRASDGRRSLLVVLHHVVTDGLGGLAQLAALDDHSYQPVGRAAPQTLPTHRDLRADALGRRRAGVAALPARLRSTVAGIREMGLDARPRILDRSYLNHPTGGQRGLTWMSEPLRPLLTACRREGVTLNDVVVAAIAGALGDAMRRQGEHPSHVVVSVPVAGPRTPTGVGNNVGVMPVDVPLLPGLPDRIRAVNQITAERKTAIRGSSAAVASIMGRSVAALGILGVAIQHQRLVTTLESSMRGPDAPLSIAGRHVERLVPFSVSPGNLGVIFLLCSYADELGISVVADPDNVPEYREIANDVGRELSRFAVD